MKEGTVNYIRGNAKSKVDLFVKTNKIEHLSI